MDSGIDDALVEATATPREKKNRLEKTNTSIYLHFFLHRYLQSFLLNDNFQNSIIESIDSMLLENTMKECSSLRKVQSVFIRLNRLERFKMIFSSYLSWFWAVFDYRSVNLIYIASTHEGDILCTESQHTYPTCGIIIGEWEIRLMEKLTFVSVTFYGKCLQEIWLIIAYWRLHEKLLKELWATVIFQRKW